MKSIVRVALALLGLVLFVPGSSWAQDPMIYCIRGGSTGSAIGFQVFVRSGGANIRALRNSLGVYDTLQIVAPMSGNTTDIRQLMVDRINNAPLNPALPAGSFTAALNFTDPYCPGWDTAFDISWSGPEGFWLRVFDGDMSFNCDVGKQDGDPNTFGLCEVNPEFVQGGGPNPPPPVVGAVPTLSEWALIVLATLMAGSMVWMLRRRGGLEG